MSQSQIPGRTVLVSGLLASVEAGKTKSLISSFPGLEKWSYVEHKETGNDARSVEAVFDTLEHAQACAYRLRHKKWNGCELSACVVGVDKSEVRQELRRFEQERRLQSQSRHRVRDSAKRGRLIVRNLHWRIDEVKLRTLFSTVGNIQEVQIPTKQDGSKRGFAFVQFEKKEDALKAVEKFQAFELKGRPIAVDLAVPKEMHVRQQTKPTNTPTGRYFSYDADINRESKENDDKQTEENDLEDGIDDVEQNSDLDQNDFEEEDEEGAFDEEDANENDENDDESDEDDIRGTVAKKRKVHAPKYDDVNEGKTVFVRNLPFRSEDADLKELFSRFGEIEIAKVVLDHETGESKGCGFVKFKDTQSVQKCLDKLQSAAGLVMERRRLSAEMALSRDQAKQKSQTDSDKARLDKAVNDRRNLHLARVGLIRGDDVLKMSKHDLNLRDKIEKVKKQKLRNSNIVVSQTRLCVHNVPRYLDDRDLRKLCVKAAGGTKNGASVTECRIMKEKTDKTVSGLGRSLGFAFVSFSTHQHALKTLNYLNNNPNVFTDEKRPVVEFSLENMLALQKKERNLLKSKTKKKGVAKIPSVNEDVLNYKSKRKMKISAKSVQLSQEKNGLSSENLDLPEPIVQTLSVSDLKSRVEHPMPRKTLLKSVDKKQLNHSLFKRSKMKKFKNKTFQSTQQEKTKSSKIKKHSERDNLDSIIEKRVQKRTV